MQQCCVVADCCCVRGVVLVEMLRCRASAGLQRASNVNTTTITTNSNQRFTQQRAGIQLQRQQRSPRAYDGAKCLWFYASSNGSHARRRLSSSSTNRESVRRAALPSKNSFTPTPTIRNTDNSSGNKNSNSSSSSSSSALIERTEYNDNPVALALIRFFVLKIDAATGWATKARGYDVRLHLFTCCCCQRWHVC